jgi:hypothetical protein
MDMRYINLYEKNVSSEYIRKTLYKEDTSVLSYYVITLILMNNYQEFLSWCHTNNTSLLQFKKTTFNLDSFCKFIEKKYKTRNMLECVSCTESLVASVNRTAKKGKDMSYIANNLRMTICELG